MTADQGDYTPVPALLTFESEFNGRTRSVVAEPVSITEQVAAKFGKLKIAIRDDDLVIAADAEVVALVGEHERAGWTVEYAVQCENGCIDPEPDHDATDYDDTLDAAAFLDAPAVNRPLGKFCGPHSVVERFVSPWVAREVGKP